jgi:hypothetical protein
MKKILTFVSLGACSLVFFVSCSVEKRQHMAGYHIEWKHGKSNVAEKITVVNKASEKGDLAANLTSPTALGIKNTTPTNLVFAASQNPVASEKTFSHKTTEKKNSENIFSGIDKKATLQSKSEEIKTLHAVSTSKKVDAVKHGMLKKKSKVLSGGGGDTQLIALLLCIFLGFLGIHRFYLGYTGLGILYLLTAGIFGIGWIIDIIRLILPGGISPK